jgi:hypothetical protein
LRDGRCFEGEISIADGFVNFDGRRRIHTGDHIMYREAGGRTWPRREIREIRWSDEDAVQ